MCWMLGMMHRQQEAWVSALNQSTGHLVKLSLIFQWRHGSGRGERASSLRERGRPSEPEVQGEQPGAGIGKPLSGVGGGVGQRVEPGLPLGSSPPAHPRACVGPGSGAPGSCAASRRGPPSSPAEK